MTIINEEKTVMKRTMWLLGSIIIIGSTFTLFSVKPAAAENPIIVTILDDIIANDGECSLREAIAAANSNVPSGFLPGECAAGSATATDVILLEAGETYNLTIQGANEDWGATGDLDILNNPDAEIDIHVKATGEGTARVNASLLNDRVWHVHAGARLVLEQVETFGGSSFLGGGLFNDNGHVTLTNAVFSLNTAYAGGAIANNGANGVIIAYDTVIWRNTATTTHGGGVLNQNGAMISLIGSNVTGNKAAEFGGGIANGLNGAANVSNTLVDSNEAGICGGGIANWDGTVSVHFGSQIVGNSAEQSGGGVCNALGTFSISGRTVVENNESDYFAGGIINAGTMLILESTVQGNRAFDLDNSGGIGGGMFTPAGSQTTIMRSTFLDNVADRGGGGLAAEGVVTIANSTISGNEAGLGGGGVLALNAGDVTLVNTTITDNMSDGDLGGAGLLLSSANVALGNTILANDGDNCHQINSTFVSLGHNLASDNTCPLTESGDQNNVDPLLGPRESGAYQLQMGSPAIDAADDTVCAEWTPFHVDQLGQERPKFNGCDIGAVEWQGFELYLPIIVR
jgi:CSLREA domain-containing protein